MELLANYNSDEEVGEGADGAQAAVTAESLLQAPQVHTLVTAPMVLKGSTSSSSTSMMLVQGLKKSRFMMNPGIDVVLAPVQGPAHPFKKNHFGGAGSSRPGAGATEAACVEDWAFNQEFQSFQRSGYARDMNDNTLLGDYSEYSKSQGNVARPIKSKGLKRQRLNVPEELGEDEQSPWAPEPEFDREQESKQELLLAATSNDVIQESAGEPEKIDGPPVSSTQSNVFIDEPDEEQEKWEKVTERKIGFTMPPRQQRGTGISEATSTFHGKELFDYQGRPWITPPSGVRAETDVEHECFVPKKCVKKYTGHTKGVQAIEFFPGTGHLLLSGSMDGKCKIWDVYGDRNVKRTYVGHSEAVRAINMSENGLEFLSSAFDRVIRLWDVETGKAKASFTNRKMGYDVKFRPTDNNIFLMAASDNKVYQWDARSGQVCQEYNYHLQPCNTVTFFDRGRKFASTSDDKKILIWEYDIPVPIKYIAEPEMHSIPSVTLSPAGDHFAGQSMDNTIVVYACGDRVKQLKKKTFTGHNNSGYACKIGFSPNSKYLISGDGLGKLHVWDWKTTKAHEGGPCMGAVWHPLSPSLIATCGWDGLVKLWD